jgi:diamine N-acetyltransferase
MLKGEKVTLRPLEREDLKRLHELKQDVELMLLASGNYQPRPLAQLEKEYEKDLEYDPTWFVIEAEAHVIGEISLRGVDRRHGTAELGVSIYERAFLNKGYGRDAINVLLEWAFGVQNLRRIWLETAAPNERAIRSYLACGFVEEGRLRQHDYFHGEYVDVVVMGLLRSEWEARRARS